MTRTRARYEISPGLYFPELDSDLSMEGCPCQGNSAKVEHIIII
jgi:hypothetical protein